MSPDLAAGSTFDVAIVGGGIVGLATAWRLSQEAPELRLLIVEKEARWASHQTGRNSGVVHSGIYYKPGSLKARLSIEGGKDLEQFCREEQIAFERCGKLIIATETEELPRLDALFQRGLEHGLPVRMVTPEEIRSIEPHAAGLAGIHVACTGITDYRGVAQALARRLEQRGAMLALGSPLTDVQDKGTTLRLTCGSRQFQVGFLMNCAGLQSDRVARLAGLNPAQKIVPFRGEYFVLRPERRHLVRHLIYPVPDPAFPFLGVHFTRMVDGSIHAGPNAVLAFGREGYSKLSLNPRDLLETLSYPGFWRMALRHWPMAIQEYRRSLSRRLFAASLARLVPGVTPDDLVPCEAGIRAQAMDTRGNMVDDFLIVHGHRSFHVLNAPSPAATASLAIAREVVRQAQSHLSA